MIGDNGLNGSTIGSEVLVGHVSEPVEVPHLVLKSLWLVHSHTGSRHCRDLDVVVSLLVTIEHHAHAILEESFGLSLCHVGSPSVLHKDLAVVSGKTSQKEVVLNTSTVQICHTEEYLTVNLADASEDS